MLDDSVLWYSLPGGAKMRIAWEATGRRYRAELALADGTTQFNSAGQPDGIARLNRWAKAEDAKHKATPLLTPNKRL